MPHNQASSRILVDRADIRVARADTENLAIADGQVLCRVDAFALTANNVTYARFGDQMKYWDFFPGAAGWGVVPVWGFAEIAESRAVGLSPGARLWGYWPMARHAVLTPTAVKPAGFLDGSPHRAGLAHVYNDYRATAVDPLYARDTEALQMIFRPLFGTSFLIDRFLARNTLFGAEQVIFSSASSKTAYAAAMLLAARGVRVIGLTSASNRAFVESLGCYAETHAYGDVGALAKKPSVYVDMAGARDLRASVHRHFADALKHSCIVGATNWDKSTPADGDRDLPGAKPQFFFAPSEMAREIRELGGAAFGAAFHQAWTGFLAKVKAPGFPLDVVTVTGADAVVQAYGRLVKGDAGPREGLIARL
ncbi:MAG: hypothetical protein RL291_1542 [Pseudomonadota bacterium]|jgi:NADPH:quinone reductase-like Zn-dependent oxidoreductase